MHKIKSIPFEKTGYFTNIIVDYLAKNEKVVPFYQNFPDIIGFKSQINEKSKSFSNSSRKIVIESLEDQYHNFEISDKTKQNISLLKDTNTFTVTTGHQLNLFTGPLYFLYKIVSTINLAKRLKKELPESNFVPVYWMASEDHDFEEIQFFNFKEEKISWNRESKGAVGRLSLEKFDNVLEDFYNQLGKSRNAKDLIELFKKSYLEHENLTDATRFLANNLFGEYGLVILDGDDRVLKEQFIPYVKEELLDQICFKEVSKTNKELAKDYKVQVNPREINLFYLDSNLRERIVFDDGLYKIFNTNLTFTKEEILQEVEDFPEKFSPNVLMRSLYQEVILPNLCYIGGGGEIAYWLEMKNFFESQKVPFPILLLRNSVLLIPEKQLIKLEKLDISEEEIFSKQEELVAKKVSHISEINIDLSEEKQKLETMFAKLEELSNKTDQSFSGAVKAQSKKQQNGLKNLEKRLLKAQKRKHKELVNRIIILQNELFPNRSLQERNANFSEFYNEIGDELINGLLENIDPLNFKFDIIKT